MLVRYYMAQGMKIDIGLDLAQISKNQFYYQPNGKLPGRPPSELTLFYFDKQQEWRKEEEIIAKIQAIKSDPDTAYGHRKMTYHLQLSGYCINHKKVYRLMKKYMLLEKKKPSRGRAYAKYRIVLPEGPLEVLEMDIKQVWVEEHRRYAYILTILDTFTRVALHWSVGYKMRKEQVKAAWVSVIEGHLQEADMLNKGIHIEVRNDNGPQFGAKAVQEFFKANYLSQVFTHPYTPQENGHIESFHAILGKSLDRHTFWTLEQLEQTLTLFYEKYNNIRLHASTAYLPPNTFWELWNKELINREVKSKKSVLFKLKVPYYKLTIGQ